MVAPRLTVAQAPSMINSAPIAAAFTRFAGGGGDSDFPTGAKMPTRVYIALPTGPA
ncbi:MAG: hypothetical protein RLZ98_2400 [Pseudomonadota bacterium]|jgi:hypothetical protein